MASGTRIELCGRLAVALDGEPVEARLRGRQGRLLFAYLVLNRDRPVRRDELTEALWTEAGSAKGDVDLAPPLSRLRKALGEGRLQGRSELTLELADDAWVDWEVAQQRIRDAGDAVAGGAWQAAWDAASEALEVSEGGLLPGLEADWIDDRRNTLDELRLDALEAQALAGARLSTGLATAARAAREVVAAAPFRESARVALIETLRAEGNTAEALRAYEEVRVFLRDELGTNPGPALMELHGRLLREENGTAASAAPTATKYVRRSAPRSAVDLVDREGELRVLERAVRQALGGEGGVLVIDGPAGIGKSRLLAEARSLGQDGLVLSAKAGQLERDFSFGVVRQLFETVMLDSALRESALSGSAAAAAPLFGHGDGAGIGEDASFAMLHGLYWATFNLAAGQPLVISVDDLHWVDPASLRFLAYLVRRLEGLPILLATTVRTGEQPTDETLFNEILHDQATVALTPRELSDEAVFGLVRDRLGAEADDSFCRACAETTRGNPLLLRQLLSALQSDDVTPDGAHADVVRALGSRAISSAVLLRMGRLSAEAGKVGRALAVLGEGPTVKALAQLAEVDEREVATATRELESAEIAVPGPPLGFVHPLVEEAVYGSLSATERDIEHTRAADILREAKASDEQIAAHLVQTSPRGEPWAATVLTNAASTAQHQGALARAISQYQRALDEGAEIEDPARLRLELAIAQAISMSDPGFRGLHEAIAAIDDPRARLRGSVVLYMSHAMAGDPAAASAAVLAVAEDLPPGDDARQALEAYAFNDFLWNVRSFEQVDKQLRELRGGVQDTGPGARILEAIVANHWAQTDGNAEEVVELARRALVPQMLEVDAGYQWVTGMVVLMHSDAPDSLSRWAPIVEQAYRGGSLVVFAGLRMFIGSTLTHRGEINDAVSVVRDALDDASSWGVGGTVMQYFHSFHAQALLESGDVAGARVALEHATWTEESSEGMRNVHITCAELLAAEGEDAQVVELADRADQLYPHLINPAYKTWQLRKIEALARLGRADEALAYAEPVLERARHFGAPGVLGETLRVIATAKGADGSEEIEESVAVLDGSVARLEFARSLAALAGVRHGAGEVDEAVALLHRAHDITQSLGAGLARRQIEAELERIGARPPAKEPTGVGSLSYFELQTAEAVASGRATQELADAMFATPRTVERQLAAVERKLGTRDPQELRTALRGAGGRPG